MTAARSARREHRTLWRSLVIVITTVALIGPALPALAADPASPAKPANLAPEFLAPMGDVSGQAGPFGPVPAAKGQHLAPAATKIDSRLAPVAGNADPGPTCVDPLADPSISELSKNVVRAEYPGNKLGKACGPQERSHSPEATDAFTQDARERGQERLKAEPVSSPPALAPSPAAPSTTPTPDGASPSTPTVGPTASTTTPAPASATAPTSSTISVPTTTTPTSSTTASTRPAAASTSTSTTVPARGTAQASSIGPLALAAASTPTFPSPDWIQQSPTNQPPIRNGAATAPDVSGNLVLFGGQGSLPNTNFYNDTWIWDGANWSQRFPATSPPARYRAVMVYDEARHVVVLFGGLSFGGTVLDDTWTWDGTNWTQRYPTSHPAARYDATGAYDSLRAQTVVQGGRNNFMPPSYTQIAFLNDTWTWDGTNWTRANPTASPGYRVGAAAAFNPPTGKIVLFGGYVFPCGTGACQGAIPAETWTWDGANWASSTPPASPSPRAEHAMAYDPDLRGVVLFGGDTGVFALNQETWLWDGTTWSQAVGIAAPGGRDAQAMAFHAGSRRMIVFGGFTSSAFLNNDTWAYSTAIPTATITADRGAAGVYSRGETVSYTVTLGNAGLAPISGLNVLSDLAGGLLGGSGDAVKIADVLTPATNVVCGTAPVLCQLLNSALSVGTLTIPAGDVFQLAYDSVAVGLDRACSTVINKVVGSVALGSALPVTSNITVCDVGLGMEDWWSYVSRDLGPQSTASVNVANGNLVVQAADSTPVQAHGLLDYTLGRTYNSADTTLLSLPNTFGAGWTLDVSQTGDLSGLGVASGGIYVPSVQALLGTALNPLGVTLIDRDGTRHVFQTKALSATVPVLGVVAGQVRPLVSGALADLVPNVLALDPAAFTNLCVDETFTAPAGVHIGLSRYIAVNALAGASNPCDPTARDPQKQAPVTIGFVAERPDRLRYEFSATGQLLDMVDPSGVDLRYSYDGLGRLTTIYEPRSCADPATPSCRAFRFSYPSATETDVADPAGRLTRYFFDTGALTKHLLRVQNPDGNSVSYTYQGVAGATCAGASPGQLCSVSDPRGAKTAFKYVGALLGPARLATITDRRSSDTNFTYPTSLAPADVVTADQAGHRQRFQSIDPTGRVGEIDEGTTADVYAHQAFYTWDAPSAACRQPDAVVDNNLCRMVRTANAPSAGYATDEDTRFVYNAEGQPLSTRQITAPANITPPTATAPSTSRSAGRPGPSTTPSPGPGWSPPRGRPADEPTPARCSPSPTAPRPWRPGATPPGRASPPS